MAIMIMGAMEDVELNLLKDKLSNSEEIQNQICTFYEGKLYGYPVVLCKVGVGSINASASTVLGIEKYKPELIIMNGVAGAHGKEVHKGDLVISTKIINIASVKTNLRKEGESSNPFEWEAKAWGATDIDMNADEKLINLAKSIEKDYTKGNVFYGVIGSGDIWNREADRILDLKEKYATLCEEMEGAAVFQIAKKYNIPVIDIRVISNNEITEEEYERTLGYYSQEFVMKLVEKYFNSK